MLPHFKYDCAWLLWNELKTEKEEEEEKNKCE
jgi:hypothetical protein